MRARRAWNVINAYDVKADQLLKDAKKTLVAANQRFGWQGDEADQAWDLLAHVLGREPKESEEISLSAQRTFERLVKRRTTGEPLAFIVGWVEFLDFKMKVRPGAFLPRLTSEFLAKQAIRRIRGRRNAVHVDLATGIGPVAIGSARAVPKARVFGADISRKAISQARANAAALGVRNASFVRSDLFDSLPKSLRGGIDVVTIHPPYVPQNEVSDLPVEIKGHEPKHTLTDGSHDGLGLVRRVVADGLEWLRPGGWLLIETTPTESSMIRGYMREAGYWDVRSTVGELKLTRVYCGRTPD
jgi:release factor glutamine methyltransferase